MTTPRRAGKKLPPRPPSPAPPDGATLHGRRARARPTRARSRRTCRQGTSRVSRARPSVRYLGADGALLSEPHDAESLGDPVDDVAYFQTPKSRRIADDEEDGVSLGPQRRPSHRRDDARVADASLVARERHEPDHRHDVLRMPRPHDKVFAMRRT